MCDVFCVYVSCYQVYGGRLVDRLVGRLVGTTDLIY